MKDFEERIAMHNLNADVKNGEINLDYVKEASKNVGGALASPQKYKVVVVKSTVVFFLLQNQCQRRCYLLWSRKGLEMLF